MRYMPSIRNKVTVNSRGTSQKFRCILREQANFNSNQLTPGQLWNCTAYLPTITADN